MVVNYIFIGFYKPGKPGKVREFEIRSGNFYDMSHGSRLVYR